MYSVNRRQNLWVHRVNINPLNVKLNPICHLLVLLGAHHVFHVSRVRVKRTSFQGSVSSDVEKIMYIWKGLNNTKRGTAVRGETPILAQKSPSQIWHELVCDPTMSSALGSWGLSDTWFDQHLVTVGKFDGGGDGSVSDGISVQNRLSPEEGGEMWPLCQQYFKNIKDVIGEAL
jgi:hypothetical protein